MVAALLRKVCRPEQLQEYPIGPRRVPFHKQLAADPQQQLENLSLPLPSARTRWTEGVARELAEQVLAEESMEPRELRVKFPRDSFFSKGDRSVLFRPSDLTVQADSDERNPGQQKLTLAFSLGRGSYATILVKRITGLALPGETPEDSETESSV
jgi:tRNA pseudouridine13 synthase